MGMEYILIMGYPDLIHSRMIFGNLDYGSQSSYNFAIQFGKESDDSHDSFVFSGTGPWSITQRESLRCCYE